MPTDVARLKTHLGITPAQPVDDAAMQYACDAANSWVAKVRPDLPPIDPDNQTPWGEDIDQAATLYAAKLYGRRGSPTGVSAFQEVGIAYIAKIDPDVVTLLELGPSQASAIA